MTAVTLKTPLVFEQGADFQKTFIWKTGNPAVPVDLTGYTARMQVRESYTATAALVSLTTQNLGITLTADGEINLKMSSTETTVMSWKKGVFDIELVSPSGYVTRLVQGNATLSPEVTK